MLFHIKQTSRKGWKGEVWRERGKIVGEKGRERVEGKESKKGGEREEREKRKRGRVGREGKKKRVGESREKRK